MASDAERATTPWWQTGVLYQIYPRSFADSDGDGIGDLRGVIEHLDHLEWLGVDGIWLSPITVSPNADWGYDVADYCDVAPEYGSLADLDQLIAEAGTRGMRILLDLVPNHTSDRHPWFVDARTSRQAAHRDWYVWADRPNNWLSSFGGAAWTWDEGSGQYYLHNFLAEQPDLNWWNTDVRRAFDDIQRFWFDRGVAGFRIDVAHAIVKDALLRDNPPASADDHPMVRAHGQRSVYNTTRPEVHDVLRRWRALAGTYQPERVLLGETWVLDLPTLASFYGRGDDELHLGFNIPFIHAPFEAAELRHVVEETEALLPPGAWPVWAGSNHDASRLASRWGRRDPARTRLALMMLLTLRGTPVLYQGDEIGVVDTEVPRDRLRDPVGRRGWPLNKGRDAVRTPMPWSRFPGRGFTAAGVEPWLPFPDPEGDPVAAAINVADQRVDPDSVLLLAHALVALRRRSPDLYAGPYAPLPSPEGVWAYRRGDAGGGTIVVLNITDGPAAWELPEGVRQEPRVALASDRRPIDVSTPGVVNLSSWQGVIITTV